MRFRAIDVAEATGGTLIGPDVAVDGVSFDSRDVAAGQLFVPLVADRDGHQFIDDSLARGAVAYLSSSGALAGGTAILVPDTLHALMQLAATRRGTFAGTVVGITGSVGKTSTKDFARAAVSAGRRTTANVKSYNNDFGLPSTLLNAADDTEVLILEMGMRGFGEIARLCRISRPSVGIVTRVAEAHSDLLGGLEGVARAKAELVAALPDHGVSILNIDDPLVAAMAGSSRASVVTYGTAPTADVCVSRVRLDDEARPAFTVDSPWGSVALSLAVSGEPMASNAAAALTLAGTLGVDLSAAAAAVEQVTPADHRMSIGRTPTGAVILDDSYNANPTSMRAGLDALARLRADRRSAVVGVMAEIDDAAAEHAAIARYAAERGIRLIAVGTELYGVAPVDDPVPALGALADGDAVLVKASRVAALERIVKSLLGAD